VDSQPRLEVDCGIGITGTPAGIVHQDATDQLFVNGGAGNDTIDASAGVRAPQPPSS
jgi:hypothetical protein